MTRWAAGHHRPFVPPPHLARLVGEVAADHSIVWDFVNPNRAGKKNELVATIYDLQRIPSGLPAQ